MTPDTTSNGPKGWAPYSDWIDGVEARSWSSGQGRPIVLIHGIGPGTCGLANFEPVLDTLLQYGEVHLIDLIGFGASGRKTSAPYFDVALWQRQLQALLERIGRPTTLIGNSIGGALAFRCAANDATIQGVLSIGSPLCATAPTQALLDFWSVPDSPAALAKAMAPMTAAGTEPSPERLAARYAPFTDPGFVEYFVALLGDPATALQEVALDAATAQRITCPMTLVHGWQDRACPLEGTALAFNRLRPDADAVLFGQCGHNVTWERTADLCQLLTAFLQRTELE
ncbi:alpha/beta fold hydrolase [Pseudomonas typographi]|uniref:Alpha/beta hydrolase n=1 Tax=Pseudomonas typographi TaxID=2715964 RepID=A0ABR7Z9H5_9PSED|nr:alpha/beta hydrolase [Pseudomonas typographi]MBD1602210.1 alpha/beta hydrolase [Pseudomonas typographi]